jgi:hypothetical protein
MSRLQNERGSKTVAYARGSVGLTIFLAHSETAKAVGGFLAARGHPAEAG